MDGLECKRCSAPDTFDDVCDSCDEELSGRVDRLMERAKKAQEKAKALVEDENFDPTDVDGFIDFLGRLKMEWEGYMKLAEIQNRLWFDPQYLEREIEAATNQKWIKKHREMGRDE